MVYRLPFCDKSMLYPGTRRVLRRQSPPSSTISSTVAVPPTDNSYTKRKLREQELEIVQNDLITPGTDIYEYVLDHLRKEGLRIGPFAVHLQSWDWDFDQRPEWNKHLYERFYLKKFVKYDWLYEEEPIKRSPENLIPALKVFKCSYDLNCKMEYVKPENIAKHEK
ncbi:expressed protein [Phakopsora pachyrhizi]|uniref:Expressed protein n=1 Tax=Phakopsora pachyrhizi TaxID=170000 RepID=A0AAV0ANI6_PHAPC|nr:expressed protein [Phakopsora pachyrhizi]